MTSIHNLAAEAVRIQLCRAEALFRSATAEYEAIERLVQQAHRTCAELRALLPVPAPAPTAPPLTAAQILAAAGLSKDDLSDLTEDLIAAYRTAEASGDAERGAVVARALRTVGQHLATEIGPRAAGVVLH